MFTIPNKGHIVKHNLKYETKSAMALGDVVATACALLDENLGLRVLPVNPDTKQPFEQIGGVNAATDDPLVFRQWAAYMSNDIALGVRLGDRMAAIDDDAGGSLDLDAWGLSGTFAERTRRGVHHYVLIDRPVRKARLPQGLGDVISGNSYIVMSPSPGYIPIDLDAPIVRIADDSPLWQFEASEPQLRADHALYTVTPADRRGAKAVVKKLLASQYRERIALILDGEFATAGYPSRSEADFALVFMASHHLRSHARSRQILHALLEQYSRKLREHRNPSVYAASVIESAISAREQTDADHRDRVRQVLRECLLSAYPEGIAKDVYDGTPPMPRAVITEAIVQFCSVSSAHVFDRGDGWRRFPVEDAAQVFGVNRKTISRALADVEAEGRIERDIRRVRHDGGHRCDSLIRSGSYFIDGDDD